MLTKFLRNSRQFKINQVNYQARLKRCVQARNDMLNIYIQAYNGSTFHENNGTIVILELSFIFLSSYL